MYELFLHGGVCQLQYFSSFSCHSAGSLGRSQGQEGVQPGGEPSNTKYLNMKAEKVIFIS